MERMLDLMQRLGDVKNSTLFGHVDTSCPPMILVWYRQIEIEASNRMISAFACYAGMIEWSFHPIRQGWAVCPKRILDLTADRRLDGFLLAPKILKDEEPQFVALCHRDLDSLTDHVSRCLR